MCEGKEKKNPHQSSVFVHQKFQLDRVHLQEVKRSSYEHTKKCADQLLLLGQVSITQRWYIRGWKNPFFLHWLYQIVSYWEMCSFQPNQTRWTVSAASPVFQRAEICVTLPSVAALSLWLQAAISDLFVGDAELPLQQMKRAIIYIIPSDYSVLFSFCPCCIHHYNLTTGLSPSLPQTDRAVQLLLETSADNPSYYCDSLKACLVTTITSSGPSQSTIKLVATNMIANGKLAGSVCVASSCSSQTAGGCLHPRKYIKNLYYCLFGL